MKYFQKTYDSGLRLIFEKNDRPITAVSIMFFVGSQNENVKEEGYAHFIEHMIFKSSEHFETEQAMDKLALLGADYNAYTSKTVTRFVFKCLKENFKETFELYSDLIIRPKFRQDELDKEREVIIEEMKKCQDDPVEVMYETAVANFYNGLSYAHDALGREENILGVSREELLEFKNRFYKANNCIISVTGNIDFEDLEKIVSNAFAKHIKGNGKPYQVDFSLLSPNIKERYKVVKRNDEQANVCITIKAENYLSDKKYIADIYTSILGNTQNSRLFKQIRENMGLVYSIYAMCDVSARLGDIAIIFGTRPKNVKKALAEIRKIIEDIAKNGVTEQEILYAKNWKKSCICYSSESSSEIADLNASMLHYHNKPITQNERIALYNKVTKEDVDAYAKQISLENAFAVVAVGKELDETDVDVFRQ